MCGVFSCVLYALSSFSLPHLLLRNQYCSAITDGKIETSVGFVYNWRQYSIE